MNESHTQIVIISKLGKLTCHLRVYLNKRGKYQGKMCVQNRLKLTWELVSPGLITSIVKLGKLSCRRGVYEVQF